MATSIQESLKRLKSYQNPTTKAQKDFNSSLTRDIKQEELATIPAQKAALRAQGLPVSVRNDRAQPTLGGSILRDILSVPATLLARPGQALGAIQGMTPEEQTVKSSYLGDIKTSQNMGDVTKDVGRGLELASYGIAVGALKSASGTLAKKSVAESLKILAAEGAASGYVGSVGSGVKNGKTGNELSKEVAKGTAISTIAGVGFAGAGKAFSWLRKGEAKIPQAAESIVEQAPITQATPEVKPVVQRGTQPNKFNQEPGNYDTPQGNIYTPESQLPTIQMGSAKAESTLPSIQIGEKSPRAVPGDFKYVPVQAPKTVTAPRTSPLENIPGYKAPEPVTTQNLPESNAPQVPKTDTAPEIKASQKKALEKTFKDDPTFEPSSFDEQIDSFNNELSINKDKVLDLATGRISQYGTLRPDTAHALLTNMEDSLDNATKLRLVNSSVPSVSGGNLGMNRLRDQDSTISILRDIKNKIENNLGKNTKNAMNNEESSTIEKFKKTLKDTIPDKQTIDNALAAITCKI